MPQVNLTWTESLSNATLVNQYLIYRSANGGDFSLIATFNVTRNNFGVRTNDLEYQDTTVSNGVTYRYYVVGHPIEGPNSENSNTIVLPTFFILQEDGVFHILLEDGSGAIVTEAAP